MLIDMLHAPRPFVILWRQKNNCALYIVLPTTEFGWSQSITSPSKSKKQLQLYNSTEQDSIYAKNGFAMALIMGGEGAWWLALVVTGIAEQWSMKGAV